ncbi:MAG: Zn-dependent hydrolase [Dethiosulfovibrio peptidovorans]|nr:MAG: Zn-dependent hydrolase [Dethiosulfovibrio peptidovorans]
MNFERFSSRMEQINRIGRREGEGISRLSLTDQDMQARSVLKDIFRSLELEVREDGAGNIWGRRKGTDESLPAVVAGSHIDTVPSGGAYDGTLGVMAAVECVAMMRDENFQNRHPVEIVSFSTEESSRFNAATLGSKTAAGILKASDLSRFADTEGVSFLQALHGRGFYPEELTPLRGETIKAFMELHIEQGPVLERENTNIGIVTLIAAPTRLKVDIQGEAAHSGACPMKYRRDALAAASEFVLAVEQAGRNHSSGKTVATVGKMEVFPGAMNVVPGKVQLFVDIRGIDTSSIQKAHNEIMEALHEICARRGVTHQVEILSQDVPKKLDAHLQDLIENSCRKLGLSCSRMPSGAGHDAMNMAAIAPGGLIFVPCIDGISHDKREDMHPEDMKNGVNVLFECVKALSR